MFLHQYRGYRGKTPGWLVVAYYGPPNLHFSQFLDIVSFGETKKEAWAALRKAVCKKLEEA